MNDLTELTRRRTVLKTIGAGVLGGAMLSGTATARGNLVSKINSNGHYAYFPGMLPTWGRQKHPFDIQQGDARWMAMPDAGGSVRCLVTGIPSFRNAGFDVHVGRLGDLDKVTIDAETVRTNRSGGTAVLFVGLYLDADDDGEFFVWEDGQGNKDSYASFGKDAEGLYSPKADGEITIDGSTEFTLFHVGGDPAPSSATLNQLQAGEVDGVEGETINGNTNVAIYVGVMSAGKGPEEVIINSLTVSSV